MFEFMMKTVAELARGLSKAREANIVCRPANADPNCHKDTASRSLDDSLKLSME